MAMPNLYHSQHDALELVVAEPPELNDHRLALSISAAGLGGSIVMLMPVEVGRLAKALLHWLKRSEPIASDDAASGGGPIRDALDKPARTCAARVAKAERVLRIVERAVANGGSVPDEDTLATLQSLSDEAGEGRASESLLGDHVQIIEKVPF